MPMKRKIRYKTLRISKSEGLVKSELEISEDHTTNHELQKSQLPKSDRVSKFIAPISLSRFGSEEITTFLQNLWGFAQGLFG